MIKLKVTLELTQGDPEYWKTLTHEIAEINTKNGCQISEPTYPEPNRKVIYITYQNELNQLNNMIEVGRFLSDRGLSCKIINIEVIRKHELAALSELHEQLSINRRYG